MGVCTSICVMETVKELFDRDLPRLVYREGVADFDPEAHAFALKSHAADPGGRGWCNRPLPSGSGYFRAGPAGVEGVGARAREKR